MGARYSHEPCGSAFLEGCAIFIDMSHESDIMGQADRVIRPAIRKLTKLPWIAVVGCCAGHKPEDALWLEVDVLGSSGLKRMMSLLSTLESKLSGTHCRVDCLLDYRAEGRERRVPHGWIPCGVEVSWPPEGDWKRSQSIVVETLLSSIDEVGTGVTGEHTPSCAINYCPFCSSSFIRLASLGESGANRYCCGDCDMFWTMAEPTL